MQHRGVHAEVEAARQLAAQVEADDVGDAGVLLAIEGARHVAQRRTAGRAAALGFSCQLACRLLTRRDDSKVFGQAGLIVVLELEAIEHDPAARSPGGTPRRSDPPLPWNRRQRRRVSKACSDTDMAWPSTGSRYQPVVELQRSSVSELRCSRRLVICHNSLAIRRADEGGEEILRERARSQRRIRIQRLEVRTAQRVALVDAHVERPVLAPLEALRQAEVREGARTVFGGLRVDARLDLRALPRDACACRSAWCRR